MNRYKAFRDWLSSEGLSGHINKQQKEYLSSVGYDNQLNEAWHKYLGSLGHTGTLSERMKQWTEGGNITSPVVTTFGTKEMVGSLDGTVRDTKGNIFDCSQSITLTSVAVPMGESSPTRLVISEVDADDVVVANLYDVEQAGPGTGVATWNLNVSLTAGKRYVIAVHEINWVSTRLSAGGWATYADPNGYLTFSDTVYSNVDPAVVSNDMSLSTTGAYLMEITYNS